MSGLIDKVFAESKAARGWLDEKFQTLRMPERIEQLKSWKQELDAELDRSVAEMWRAGAEIAEQAADPSDAGDAAASPAPPPIAPTR